MSKITLKVEIEEEAYKQIKGDSIYDNNNKIIISKSSLAYYALNAIINATPITECDDCVSRQAVLEQTYNWSKDEFLRVTNPFDYLRKRINFLPSVLPKREENTVSEEVYTDEYTRRKALEYENYVLKQNMQALRCGNER